MELFYGPTIVKQTVLWGYFLYDQSQNQLRNIEDENALLQPDNNTQ